MNADLRKTIDLDFPGQKQPTGIMAELANLAPYGFCPICYRVGTYRERRPNGDDECFGGHVYPSRQALTAAQLPSGCYMGSDNASPTAGTPSKPLGEA